MCGLLACLGIAATRAALDVVAHRGPDGEGWREWATVAGPLILGHRRLAIIDTSPAGAQPMATPDQQSWIIFNGEIYNYPELRGELEALGHTFWTRSDTEVLLAAYRHWGEACLDRLNGMFAFIVADFMTNRLFAARDRFGVKPLYLWSNGHGVAFASEIKQFTRLAGFRAEMDEASIHAFLIGGMIDHDSRTFFAGVRQLRGGECMDVALDRPFEVPAPRRWYRRPTVGTLDIDAAPAAARLRELLADAIRLRLRSDVPVGSCLSGGLDSSAIVCLAAPQLTEPMVTVSACYDEPAIDERPFIDAVNRHVITRPVQVFPEGRRLPEVLDRLVHHQDGPFGSTSVFAQWCVFETARREGVPVMLDGQGADEQLCGYGPSFTAFHAQLLQSLRLGLLARELVGQRRRHGTPAASQAAVLARALLPEPVRRALRGLRGLTRPGWLRPGFTEAFDLPLPAVASLEDLIATQLFDTSLPMLLHYEDRNSMAHGVESRLPFLDWRFVEFAVALGARHKIVDGETKWLLRRAMAGVLPRAIETRQDKIGFATPERDWLAGPARMLADSLLPEAAGMFPALFDGKALSRLREDVLAGARPFDFTLWRIISFTAWAKTFGIAR